MNLDPELFELFHLADSALPTGGYAFSSGLETAAKLGGLGSIEGLEGYLASSLEQMGDFELPFLNAFCRLDHPGEALARYHAMLVTPSMRKASLLQGRGLLRLLAGIHPRDRMTAIRAGLDSFPGGKHFLAVLGRSLRGMRAGDEAGRRLVLFVALRDQVSAAIRLGLVGPIRGHALQHGLYPLCHALAEQTASAEWTTACRTAPLVEIYQGYHPRLYSRLFQN